jgi:hypothetical protein
MAMFVRVVDTAVSPLKPWVLASSRQSAPSCCRVAATGHQDERQCHRNGRRSRSAGASPTSRCPSTAATRSLRRPHPPRRLHAVVSAQDWGRSLGTVGRRRHSRRSDARFAGGACRSTRARTSRGPPLAVVACQAPSPKTLAATRSRAAVALVMFGGRTAAGAGDRRGRAPSSQGGDRSPADDPHASGPSGRSAIAFFP